MKQVIVIRKDLKMRRGKECSQSAHAACMWLIEKINKKSEFTITELEWMNDRMTKVTLQVDSEDELKRIYSLAKELNLVVHMIEDLGKTEFHGVPTLTCLAIGPDDSEKIDLVTKNLKLY